MRRMKAAIAAAALATMGVVVPVQASVAADGGTGTNRGCPNQSWRDASVLGSPTYTSWGTAVGKWNDSSLASTLSYSMGVSATVSSSMQGGSSISLSSAILTVNAETSYNVTASVTGNRTVTDGLTVPGKRYGYDQPKVEKTTFEIRQYSVGSNCVQTSRVLGYLNGITAAPYFSSCVSTAACTPKP